MHGDQYFFELPIYIEAEDFYYEKLRALLEDKAQKAWQSTSDPRKDIKWHRRRIERLRDHYLKGFGGAWRYNQIFGFLGIYPLGCQLRGTTWYTAKKIVRRNIHRKDICLYGKAFELTVSQAHDSADIFSLLMDRVQKLKKESPFVRRHIETRPLELAGPFLDWRKLMDISTRVEVVRVEEIPKLLEDAAADNSCLEAGIELIVRESEKR